MAEATATASAEPLKDWGATITRGAGSRFTAEFYESRTRSPERALP